MSSNNGGLELSPVNSSGPYKDDPAVDGGYRDDPEQSGGGGEHFEDEIGASDAVVSDARSRPSPLRCFLWALPLVIVIAVGVVLGTGMVSVGDLTQGNNANEQEAAPQVPKPTPGGPKPPKPTAGGIGPPPSFPEEPASVPEAPAEKPQEEPASEPQEPAPEPEPEPASEPQEPPPAPQEPASQPQEPQPQASNPADGMAEGGFASFSSVNFENSGVTVELPEVTVKALENSDSPQSKALHWISENYADQLDGMAEWRKQQLIAMASIYYAVGGDEWHDASRVGWMEPSTLECQWPPKAQDCSESQQVTEIYLHQIDTNLPPEIGLLTSLGVLEVRSEKFAVSPLLAEIVPQQIVQAADSLQSLDVLCTTANRERMMGSIPAYFWALTKLTSLVLRSSMLDGDLNGIGSLTNLRVFDIRDGKMGGSLPAQIGSLTALQSLSLVKNLITGSLPKELGKLTALDVFEINNNRFTGPIPEEFGGMTSLENLSLGANGLDGAIPTTLGLLTNLKILQLKQNKLTGPIPAQLGQMTNMRDFRLGHNQLTGALPAELGGLVNAVTFIVTGNLLVGTIPPELGQLVNVVTDFNLSHNQLTGTVPTELGKLVSIANRLDVGFNKLRGTIPTELGSLGETIKGPLDLSHNELTGTVPTELASLVALKLLKLDQNKLSGDLPLGICEALPDNAQIWVDCNAVACGPDCPCQCS